MHRIFEGVDAFDICGVTFSYDKKCDDIPGFNLHTYHWVYYRYPEESKEDIVPGENGKSQIYIYGQTRDLLVLLNHWNKATSRFKYWYDYNY